MLFSEILLAIPRTNYVPARLLKVCSLMEQYSVIQTVVIHNNYRKYSVSIIHNV